METKFAEIIKLNLHPQENKKLDRIVDLIERADSKTVTSLSPMDIIYIMNIQAADTVYKSLVFDNWGNIFKFKETSKQVSEVIFKRLGFSYQDWLGFLRVKFNQKKICFPYVTANTAFLRIPLPKQRNHDWINIGLVKNINYQLEEISFHFILQNSHRGQLKITLSRKLKTILLQLKMVRHFMNAWYQYQSDQLPSPHIKYQTTLRQISQLTVDEPTNNIEQLNATDLEVFIRYAHIQDFKKNHNSTKNQKVSRLLKSE